MAVARGTLNLPLAVRRLEHTRASILAPITPERGLRAQRTASEQPRRKERAGLTAAGPEVRQLTHFLLPNHMSGGKV